VDLAWDKEIIGTDGTYGVSAGSSGGKKISSLSFVTNKRNHGPFGCATRIDFTVPWSKSSFAGFYGTAKSMALVSI
ncbi:mannose-binding lectin, partial [Tanacetum coccineum]